MTTLLYLQDPESVRCVATVEMLVEDGASMAVVLDTSPFFCRSGGQPSDRGWISGPNGEIDVQQVIRSVEGVVLHRGRLVGALGVGDRVEARIDSDWRRLTARVHSAGEVLCAAVHELGRRWEVGPASHVPGQSRVVFYSDLAEAELSGFINALHDRVHQIIARDEEVLTFQNVPEAEAASLCAMDQVLFREKIGNIRLVSPVREFYRPCTGAHVARTSQIGGVHFRKVSLRDRELSVAYDVQLET